jgi:hypothetical protein
VTDARRQGDLQQLVMRCSAEKWLIGQPRLPSLSPPRVGRSPSQEHRLEHVDGTLILNMATWYAQSSFGIVATTASVAWAEKRAFSANLGRAVDELDN